MAEPVRLERDGPVAILVLDNPPLNLFNRATFEALSRHVGELAASDARALVWRAEGDTFSAGVDVHEFSGTRPSASEDMFSGLISVVRKIEALPFPTLALAHGLCLTAGLEVSLGCDLFWASESARFGLVEAVVGLTPGAGGTQRIAERAGPARAREFVMTGGLYDAPTMERWNLVNRVVGDGELTEKGMRFAHRLAAGPTRAHAATKRIVRAFLEDGIDGADKVTPRVSGDLFATEDLQRAVQTFLEEGPGKATFEGR
jgi:enoyl-CoA hydratase/carnithine racemase